MREHTQEGHMTRQYELDMRRATKTFLANVLQAAERAAIEGIQSAFQQASEHEAHTGDTVGAARNELPPPEKHAHRRAPAPIDRAAMRERIVACIRDNPGCNTTLLSRSLGTHRSKLRGPLGALAKAGAIRSEARVLGFGRRL